ncbi:MAG: hypothetical protein ABJ004_04885 [Cyclobacteriaceae bacterium]
MNSKYLLSYICIFFFFATQAQTSELDSTEFSQAIEYLERKLNYTYHSDDQGLWWINKFSCDRETGEITIQNTSTKSLGKVFGKTYKTNTVLLRDLNPLNMTLTEREETAGRFARGHQINLYTVKSKPLVSKSENNVRLTPRSFIYISIPEFMDEQHSVSDSVFTLLQKLVYDASGLENKENVDTNFDLIFDALLGDHQYELNGEKVSRFGEQYNEYIISFGDYQNRQKLQNVLFGFDPTNARYYEMIVKADGAQSITYYSVAPSKELKLVSEDGNAVILFESRAKVICTYPETSFELTQLEN